MPASTNNFRQKRLIHPLMGNTRGNRHEEIIAAGGIPVKRKWIRWAILGAVAALLAALVVLLEPWDWETLDLEKLTQLNQTSIIYDADGKRAGSLYGSENRVYVPLDSIPLHVRQAFIAAEDQRFYEHHGVDVVRMFGALWHDLRTLSLEQGASTITQQLIKLTHLSGEKTFSRKAQEAILALQLERRMEKDDILERYLNVVNFGRGAYGIEAAANAYFQKSAKDLTLAEGALLAGVIKSPSNYAPHLAPENAVERRDLILGEMSECGFISPAEAEKAQKEPLVLQLSEESAQFGWYLDAAATEAQEILGITRDELLSGGYAIYTALDVEAQAAAEDLFENGANFPDPAADGTPAQAALVAENVDNGEIIALVGGRTYDVQLGLNRATQIRRQPGSAIKPVSSYAAAVEGYGYLPTSFVDDTPRVFAGGYQPGNAGGNYYGEVTLREALSRSLNVATVDLAETVGIAAVRAQLERFGISPAERDADLALALGSMTEGVSPARLCAAYCALANGGRRVEAHTVRKIVSSDGKVLYESPQSSESAVSAETASILTDMLRTAASEGSANALSAVGANVAGKTGTVDMESGGNRDAWTVAYTPRLAVAVWMGFDEPDSEHSLPDWAGGSSYPARLCASFLSSAGSDWLRGDFALPDTLRRVVIDKLALEQDKTVALAAERTPQAYAQAEVFYKGREPQIVSSKWDAPEPVTDLELVSGAGETPVLRFTARDENSEYLLIRRTDGRAEEIAVLRGKAGEILQYTDGEAELSQAHEYSIIPRHALLYEEGETVTGAESLRVRYTPGGLLGHIKGLLSPEEGQTPGPEAENDQSLFW